MRYFICVRDPKLKRTYQSVHADRDCRELNKTRGRVVELPVEWARYLTTCSRCVQHRWSPESPAPAALFRWYREILERTTM